MINVDHFDEHQTGLLRVIVSDLSGPTATEALLGIIEALLPLANPGGDYKADPQALDDSDLRAQVEVCLAALQYAKVKAAAER